MCKVIKIDKSRISNSLFRKRKAYRKNIKYGKNNDSISREKIEQRPINQK